MTPTKIRKRLIEFGPSVLTEYAPPDMHGRCIRATKLGIDVLARFGVIALPQLVIADIANRHWLAWIREGAPGGNDEMLRRGGWFLSNDQTIQNLLPRLVESGPYPATDVHMVVQVPEWRHIIDLDMRQFNRPQKDIVLPAAAALPWAEGMAEGTFIETGAAVRYRPWPDQGWKEYEQTVSWVGTWIDPAVDLLERRMRKGAL